jgi:hypothetical protein
MTWRNVPAEAGAGPNPLPDIVEGGDGIIAGVAERLSSVTAADLENLQRRVGAVVAPIVDAGLEGVVTAAGITVEHAAESVRAIDATFFHPERATPDQLRGYWGSLGRAAAVLAGVWGAGHWFRNRNS